MLGNMLVMCRKRRDEIIATKIDLTK